MDLGRFEVALDVKDIARSLEFYKRLGFRVVDGSVERRFLTLECGDCRIGLYQGHLDPAGSQLIFVQGEVEQVAATAADAVERGPATHADGGVAALLRDPDGHPLYFVRLPRA